MNKLGIIIHFYFFTSSFFMICFSGISAEKILKELSLRQKIAQLCVVAAATCFDQPTEALASSLKASPYRMDKDYILSLINTYGIGGVIFLYKSSPEMQITVTKEFQQNSQIPLFILQDAEWGLDMRLGIDPKKIVRYPRAMTLGAISDVNIIYEIAVEIGKQCTALGVHMNLAPVLDINNNKANPVIHMRSFGDDPEEVAKRGTLFIRGLQDGGVLTCAKHFPGHGDTALDSHLALPRIDHNKARFDSVELVPFKKALHNQVDAIMLAHIVVPSLDTTDIPATLSQKIITDLLQKELGFSRLVITDGLGMDAVSKNYEPGYLELAAFLAGNDILLCPLDVPKAIDLIEQEILSGRVSEKELDKRVLKILQAKEFIVKKQKKEKSGEYSSDFFISQYALELQKKAYRAAVTVFKQDQITIFSPELLETSFFVQVGSLPEEILLKLIKNKNSKPQKYSAHFLDFELDYCMQEAEKTDTIIIAVGDMNTNISKNFGISGNLLNFVKQMRSKNKKTVVILFGTPYSLDFFADTDTCIVAYEDVPVMQEAIFDLLCGRLQATGKLPIKVNAETTL
jgi:beta-N-acetylhexosaminidase